MSEQIEQNEGGEGPVESEPADKFWQSIRKFATPYDNAQDNKERIAAWQELKEEVFFPLVQEYLMSEEGKDCVKKIIAERNEEIAKALKPELDARDQEFTEKVKQIKENINSANATLKQASDRQAELLEELNSQ